MHFKLYFTFWSIENVEVFPIGGTGGYNLHLLSFIIAQEGDTSQNYLPAFDVLSTNKSDCIFYEE